MTRSIYRLYGHSLALLTDLYQLTMSYAYWKQGLDRKESVFHLFFRKRPFKGGFTIAAGLEYAIDFLENFHFDQTDLAYLANLHDQFDLPLFEPAFLDYLSNLKFSCSVDAVPEGSTVFPYQPLLRIQGPLIQCQILESPLLNILNFSGLIATKAARVCIAAGDDPVLEFGVRRAQGIDGALTASRAAYIGGCEATSNVLAGKIFGIPVKGTHAHSWIMVFNDEESAFRSFAEVMPNQSIFLVDTYDTVEGIKKAIKVGLELKEQGKKFIGIRLDSGDLTYLSIKGRRMLDDAGFKDAIIVASNELDETVITELKRQGARISVWGIGTNLITAKDQPALDGVYKLSAIRDPGGPWEYKLKLSEQMIKVSNPGILQVRRYYSSDENIADMIYDIRLGINEKNEMIDPLDPTLRKAIANAYESRDLLVPIFREGERVYELPTLHECREKTKAELDSFPVGIKRILNPHRYYVGMEKTLYNLKVDLIQKIRDNINY